MKKYPLFLLLILLSSCTTKVHLGYTPTIEKQEANNIPIAITPFDDIRAKKAVVGALRNLYGMPLVKIVTNDSVPHWVTTAFKTELSNAGYQIADHTSDQSYTIEGKILKVFASAYFIYHGRMEVEISLKKGPEILFTKLYQTKESPGINWAAQSSTCVRTLELNLQKICQQFVTDINQKILSH